MMTSGMQGMRIAAAVLMTGCTIVFDESANVDAGGLGGPSATGTSTATASLGGTSVVPAPQYEASIAVVTLLTNSAGQVSYVDPRGVVTLSLEGQGGQEWAIVHGQNLSGATFSEADAWFAQQKASANPLAWGSWDTSKWGPDEACGSVPDAGDGGTHAACPTFTTSSFITVADDLSQPLYDALLVRNRGGADVVSYEIITLTFTAQS